MSGEERDTPMKTLQTMDKRCGWWLGLLAAALAGAPAASGITYGLKSQDYYNTPAGQFSGSPTHLFRFREDGSQFTDLGQVSLGGAGIDADGLAISPQWGLMGFQLTERNDANDVPRDARLVAIDPGTAAASPVGSWLAGRDVRGAVFDLADRLWALDARNDELLRVDPATGGVVSGWAVALSLDVDTTSDIAVRHDGQFYLTSYDRAAGESVIYELDQVSGALQAVHGEPGQGLVGLTFSEAAEADHVFAFEVNDNSVSGLSDNDDVFRYDIDPSWSRAVLHGDVIVEYNAGRGDLASAMIPEPLTALGLVGGAVAVGAHLRRRRRV